MEATELLDEFNPERMFNAVREEESLFARGDDDALIRYVRPTLKQFEEKVTLVIDGIVAKDIPKARPLTDALGNPRRDSEGNLIPRATTIYDAALTLVERRLLTADELKERIPVLCHQQHLHPVAVCRICSVHISGIKRGKFTGGRKLVPACQHRVEDKMAVISRRGPRDFADFLRVLGRDFAIKPEDQPSEKSVQGYAKLAEDSVHFLNELLVADHLPPEDSRGDRYENELSRLGGLLGDQQPNRFSLNPGGIEGRNRELHPKSRPIPLTVLTPDKAGSRTGHQVEFKPDPLFPYASRSIHVDHDRCILCDRCVRSCSEVKPFKVIGHTGKGYRTRISFDLDKLMNNSSCVQCGECMTSCPTGALTLNRRVSPRWAGKEVIIPEDPDQALPARDGFSYLTAEEMRAVELSYEEDGKERSFFPFRDIPYSYLRWNEGAVRLRSLEANEVLCRQGDFGSTAFLLGEGSFNGTRVESSQKEEEAAPGFWSWLRRSAKTITTPSSAPPRPFQLLARRDLILGEIACLTNSKRTATVVAATPAVVYEMTRNMLGMMLRNPAARLVLDRIYCRRAIANCLDDLFEELVGQGQQTEAFRRGDAKRQAIAAFEKDAEVLRVEPGGVIVAEGDRIGFDDQGQFLGDFYIVVLGFVKVSRHFQDQEVVLGQLTKGQYFGEIGLLPDHPVMRKVREEEGIDPGRRTATCAALGDVEIVRIPGRTFRQVIRPDLGRDENNPFARIADGISARGVERLRQQIAPPRLERDRLGEFVHQGLYQGRKMLVLDLLSCTRCDECTKACAKAHGDVHSRLLREGLRYGDFLVAASCRSCHQPYCMDGCPVDAIHRNPTSPEILIEGHCIGCSLCERNCPYGSIQMVPKERGKIWTDLLKDVVAEPQATAAIARRAVNCDLCNGLVKPGQDPFCVSACPHRAAFRWSGEELQKEVARRSS